MSNWNATAEEVVRPADGQPPVPCLPTSLRLDETTLPCDKQWRQYGHHLLVAWSASPPGRPPRLYGTRPLMYGPDPDTGRDVVLEPDAALLGLEVDLEHQGREGRGRWEPVLSLPDAAQRLPDWLLREGEVSPCGRMVACMEAGHLAVLGPLPEPGGGPAEAAGPADAVIGRSRLPGLPEREYEASSAPWPALGVEELVNRPARTGRLRGERLPMWSADSRRVVVCYEPRAWDEHELVLGVWEVSEAPAGGGTPAQLRAPTVRLLHAVDGWAELDRAVAAFAPASPALSPPEGHVLLSASFSALDERLTVLCNVGPRVVEPKDASADADCPTLCVLWTLRVLPGSGTLVTEEVRVLDTGDPRAVSMVPRMPRVDVREAEARPGDPRWSSRASFSPEEWQGGARPGDSPPDWLWPWAFGALALKRGAVEEGRVWRSPVPGGPLLVELMFCRYSEFHFHERYTMRSVVLMLVRDGRGDQRLSVGPAGMPVPRYRRHAGRHCAGMLRPDARWSPDGAHVALLAGPGHALWVARTDTGAPATVTGTAHFVAAHIGPPERNGRRGLRQFEWTADGATLLLMAYKPCPPAKERLLPCAAVFVDVWSEPVARVEAVLRAASARMGRDVGAIVASYAGLQHDPQY